MSLEVTYNENDRVKKVVNLKEQLSESKGEGEKKIQAASLEESTAPANANFTHRSPEVDQPTQAER